MPRHDAWNPGLSSDIPARLLPHVTLYRAGASSIDYKMAKEAADFCGLDAKDLISLTVERLITHELLIRVTGDLTVPDGPNYEELGINLRGMVAQIYEHILPELDRIKTEFKGFESHIEIVLNEELEPLLAPPPPEEKPGFFARLMGKSEVARPENPMLDTFERWKGGDPDPIRSTCVRALLDVTGGIVATHGRLVPDASLIVDLAGRIVRNTAGGSEIGRIIKPMFWDAVEAEGYRRLPPQVEPVFMNVKGASAAGKSTIRPEQRKLAEKLGIPWEDFALISPDYWRKYLLDYESLGDDHKYGAMLTGHELEMIDRKLDAYMAAKHEAKTMPHLLIDRFRFDSFVTAKDSNLLTRFGHRVYLFFMVTPPAETVERAWKRGQSTGRYKAVDDLLYHNIEAYEGMPRLFFSWMENADRNIKFEFLDNSVPLGERPRTIAYGSRDAMVVLDLERLCDITRFAKVNIDATCAAEVLEATDQPPVKFLRECVQRIEKVTFAQGESRDVYAQTHHGKLVFGGDLPPALTALSLENGPAEPPVKLTRPPYILGV